MAGLALLLGLRDLGRCEPLRLRIKYMVLVTETGYELLSLFPQELIECWIPY